MAALALSGSLSQPVGAASGLLTAVPPAGGGVCALCHGCCRRGWMLCTTCARVSAQLSQPCPTIVPISLYRPGDRLHRVLRRYKDAPLREARAHFRAMVAAIIDGFLARHERCLSAAAGASFDVVTIVPSSARAGRSCAVDHPLHGVAAAAVPFARERLRTLLVRGEGPLGHLVAGDAGFAPVPACGIAGATVLLLDDTLTSGARVQSAASALRLAGARTVTAVVVGRVVHPERDARHARFWAQAAATAFDGDLCALCSAPWSPARARSHVELPAPEWVASPALPASGIA